MPLRGATKNENLFPEQTLMSLRGTTNYENILFSSEYLISSEQICLFYNKTNDVIFH